MTELTYNLPEKGEARSASDGKVREGLSKIKEAVNGKLDHTNLSSTAEITKAQLSSEAKPVAWYTPKIIATEQTRESTSFGTLSTADEITGVELHENGLIAVGYTANAKSSTSGAGRAAIFIGANQLKNRGTAVEATTSTTELTRIFSSENGLSASTSATALATTGELLGNGGGLALIFAAAGTYAISVKYRATSGSITAKERKLWVVAYG